jgi:hypothetical protein
MSTGAERGQRRDDRDKLSLFDTIRNLDTQLVGAFTDLDPDELGQSFHQDIEISHESLSGYEL